ncbi:MAG TPA: TIGR01212 family radical SAM protein [Bacilli bacterium]|nr:TIGR01212 family radical SAM protein [Bacilli bacterium]
MFNKTLDNKRYHTLNYYYENKFHNKVCKVSLNGNFSCPNYKNNRGCIFCSLSGSGEFGGDKNEPLNVQFDKVSKMMLKKWPNAKFIAYFQANTNTYAPLNILKEKYETALGFDNVIGISIATRCDAISDEVLDYLDELNKKTFLTVELGLQSMHKKTLSLINRGHDLKSFESMVKKLQQRQINVVVHIINGLPYETKEDMINTAKYLNSLNIDGIKIHMLYILKNTKLADMFNKDKFHILTKEEYIDIVCDQLTYLNENIVIHRITGDPKIDDLIEPKWLVKKFCVLNDIDKEMKKRNIYQGKNC